MFGLSSINIYHLIKEEINIRLSSSLTLIKFVLILFSFQKKIELKKNLKTFSYNRL